MTSGFRGHGGVVVASCYNAKCEEMRAAVKKRGHATCVTYIPEDDTGFAFEYGKLIQEYAKPASDVVVIVGDAGEEGRMQQKEMEFMRANGIKFRKVTLEGYETQWPLAAGGPAVSQVRPEPVHDFWHAENREHTFHFGDPWPGEEKKEIIFWAFRDQFPGTEPVYDFWHRGNREHTFHFGSPWHGEEKKGIQFWAFRDQFPGTEPVYDFWHRGNREHTFHFGNPWHGEEKKAIQFWAFRNCNDFRQ